VEPQHKCRYANETDESPWVPVFRDELGKRTVKVSDVKYVIGVPGCGTRQEWHIYNTSLERMLLLEDGTLRHYILNDVKHDDEEEDDLSNVQYFHSYKTGSYCMEKVNCFILFFKL
jgi:G protein-coupled receptor Mth (Methuselah protein)